MKSSAAMTPVGEEIGALVDVTARHLLGREVAELAVGTHRGVRFEGVDVGARDAEIGDLHIAVNRDEHVGRADITMDDSERAACGVGCAVHGVEAAQDLAHHDRRRDRARAFRLSRVSRRLSRQRSQPGTYSSVR